MYLQSEPLADNISGDVDLDTMRWIKYHFLYITLVKLFGKLITGALDRAK